MSTVDAQVEAWIADLCNAWMERNVNAALQLFDQCKDYRETPFSHNAAALPADLEVLWEEVLGQSDISVCARLRVVADEKACVEYRASYTSMNQCHVSSGIWIVGFENGACVSFEQWSVLGDATR